MIKIDEIRQNTDAELTIALDEVKDEFFRLRMAQSLGQLEKPSRMRQLRRQIARFETVKTERRTGVVAPGSETARQTAAISATEAPTDQPDSTEDQA